MTFRYPLLRALALAAVLVGLVSPASARTDRKFVSSPTLSTEARTLVNLLEQAHYNRDAVRSGDFAQVISSYMGDLDGQRLFFLDTDKKNFNELLNNMSKC